jgi:hypothetical protein
MAHLLRIEIPSKPHCLARIEPSNELESCRTPRWRRTNDRSCTRRKSDQVQQLGWQRTKEHSARGSAREELLADTGTGDETNCEVFQQMTARQTRAAPVYELQIQKTALESLI